MIPIQELGDPNLRLAAAGFLVTIPIDLCRRLLKGVSFMEREPSPASLELAAEKLTEANWFIDQFESAGFDIFAAKCLASAGISALVATLDALKAAAARDPRFKDWARTRRTKLREDPAIAYLFERRNEMAHVGYNRINAGRSFQEGGETRILHYFSRGIGTQEEIDVDVGTAMRHLSEGVEAALNDARAEFPEQTAEWQLDLRRLYSEGNSIEDLEAYLGMPRGWTGIGGLTDEQRIEMLEGDL